MPRYYQDLLGISDLLPKPDYKKYLNRFMENGMYWSTKDYMLAFQNEEMFHNSVKERKMRHLEYLKEQK